MRLPDPTPLKVLFIDSDSSWNIQKALVWPNFFFGPDSNQLAFWSIGNWVFYIRGLDSIFLAPLIELDIFGLALDLFSDLPVRLHQVINLTEAFLKFIV